MAGTTRRYTNGQWGTFVDGTNRRIGDPQADGTRLRPEDNRSNWKSVYDVGHDTYWKTDDSTSRQYDSAGVQWKRAWDWLDKGNTNLLKSNTGMSVLRTAIKDKANTRTDVQMGDLGFNESGKLVSGGKQPGAYTGPRTDDALASRYASGKVTSAYNDMLRKNEDAIAGEYVDTVVQNIRKDIDAQGPAYTRTAQETRDRQNIGEMTNPNMSMETRTQARRELDASRQERKADILRDENDKITGTKSGQKYFDDTQKFIDDMKRQLGQADAKGGKASVRAAENAGSSAIVVPVGTRTYEQQVGLVATPKGSQAEREGKPSPTLKPDHMLVSGQEGTPDEQVPLPNGAFVSNGRVFVQRTEPVMKNRLEDLSDAAKSAYDDIQMEFTAKNGRTMDREVAIIRALRKSGDIDLDTARKMAWELRRNRDMELARRVADSNGDRKNWEEYYVPTTREMLSAEEGIRGGTDYGKAVLGAMNQFEIDAGNKNNWTPGRKRNLYLAHRLNLAPEIIGITERLGSRIATKVESIIDHLSRLHSGDYDNPTRDFAMRKTKTLRENLAHVNANSSHERRPMYSGKWVHKSSKSADKSFRRLWEPKYEDLTDTLYMLQDQ